MAVSRKAMTEGIRTLLFGQSLSQKSEIFASSLYTREPGVLPHQCVYRCFSEEPEIVPHSSLKIEMPLFGRIPKRGISCQNILRSVSTASDSVTVS